jgi:hypothetical protein
MLVVVRCLVSCSLRMPVAVPTQPYGSIALQGWKSEAGTTRVRRSSKTHRWLCARLIARLATRPPNNPYAHCHRIAYVIRCDAMQCYPTIQYHNERQSELKLAYTLLIGMQCHCEEATLLLCERLLTHSSHGSRMQHCKHTHAHTRIDRYLGSTDLSAVSEAQSHSVQTGAPARNVNSTCS